MHPDATIPQAALVPEPLTEPGNSSKAAGEGKTIILGLGNDILADDAVGLIAARQLRCILAGKEAVDVFDTSEMGLALLDFLVGYDNAIIIDSIQTEEGIPGSVYEWDPASEHAETISSPHFVGVPETLALGRELGFKMPGRIVILAVEIEDAYTIGQALTDSVRNSLPAVLNRAKALVEGS